MVTTSSDLSDTPFGAPPRPLTEDVLQSAEEAVLANPASVETLQGDEFAPGAGGQAPGLGTNADRLGRIVGEKPVQSALVALAAGALLASLARLALARRRRR
jgi:hypothetical protein